MTRYRVRVRGIYATATAKILLDEGFKLADVSPALAARLGVNRNLVPPDTTVKTLDEDPDQLMVIGEPDAASSAASTLKRRILTLISREIFPGPYSVLKVRVRGKKDTGYSVETPYGPGLLASDREGEPGTALLTYVQRPGKPPLLREGIAVTGKTVVVATGGGGVRLSGHIRDTNKIILLTRLASTLARGVNVRWRSGAALAGDEELAGELSESI